MSIRTYISFVIQKESSHRHDFEIIDVPETKISKYSDNTSQEVIKWSVNKQSQLQQDEKLVILNYFNISDLE